jgi:autotransporter translocation and assembly factor TamB
MMAAAKTEKSIKPRKPYWRSALVALRHLSAWLLTVVTLLLMTAVGAMFFLQTEKGMRFLERSIVRFASTDDIQVAVRLERIGWHHIIVPSVALADPKGLFLRVENIDLRINPLAYLTLSPVIDSLTVQMVDLQRFPEVSETDKEDAAKSGQNMPSFLADIRKFDIEKLRTGPAVYGREEIFRLQSRLQLSSKLDKNDIAVLLESYTEKEKAGTYAHIRFAPDAAGTLQLTADVRDAAGGVLMRLMGLPTGYDIDVKTTASGMAERWQGQTDLRLGDVMNGKIDWLQENNILTMRTDLSGPKKIFVKGQAQLPLSFDPPALRMKDKLSGQFSTVLDLKAITVLMGLDDHRMTGRAEINVTLSGTPAAPQMIGTADLKDGTYENLASGAKLSKIAAHIDATRDALRLTRLTAVTPKNGSLSATGIVSLKNIQNPAFRLDATLDKAQVVAQQNTDVRISGDVHVTGDAKSAQVAGNILLNRVDVYLANFGGSSTASMLNIKEVNVPPHLRKARREKKEVSTGSYDVALDVKIEAPKYIFVEAQGLTTEWATKLHITGSVNEPVVNGYLKLLQGKYEIFNARLNLTTGNINFNGGDIADPDLDIKGNIKGRTVTANITVGGTVKNPDVELTSTPALPQDEILAKVLFNKSVDELSPLEMIKVAEFIGVMTGTIKKGVDPLTKLRKKMGIDMLSVNRDDASGNTSISVGKQISEGVYISVDQGVNAEGSSVKVEIDVTPSIQVETRVGNDDANSVGVNWKKDY